MRTLEINARKGAERPIFRPNETGAPAVPITRRLASGNRHGSLAR